MTQSEQIPRTYEKQYDNWLKVCYQSLIIHFLPHCQPAEEEHSGVEDNGIDGVEELPEDFDFEGCDEVVFREVVNVCRVVIKPAKDRTLLQ